MLSEDELCLDSCACFRMVGWMDGWMNRLMDGWMGGKFSVIFFSSTYAIILPASPSAPKEEYLITDVAYCEQAVIFLKQAKLERDGGQRRKEEGTLPVSPEGVCRSG